MLRNNYPGDVVIHVAVYVVWTQLNVVGMTLSIKLPEIVSELACFIKVAIFFLRGGANLTVPIAGTLQHLKNWYHQRIRDLQNTQPDGEKRKRVSRMLIQPTDR